MKKIERDIMAVLEFIWIVAPRVKWNGYYYIRTQILPVPTTIQLLAKVKLPIVPISSKGID